MFFDNSILFYDSENTKMKKLLSVFLAVLTIVCLLTFIGCGKAVSEKTVTELILGDWYTYSGAPYRSIHSDGTVTGTNNYSSLYKIEGSTITWDTMLPGSTASLEFYTDGNILRLSSDIGGYFTSRKYYCRSAEGIAGGTGLPEKGTSDEGIFGSWYDGDTLFFTLNSDCSLSDYRDLDSFSFTGEELVLFAEGASSDEAAKCSLSGDTLTIYYTDELTGDRAELVLKKNP